MTQIPRFRGIDYATHSRCTGAGGAAGRLWRPGRRRPLGCARHHGGVDYHWTARYLASTTTVPSRAKQLQAALKKEDRQVKSVAEDADGVTIKTGYIFT